MNMHLIIYLPLIKPHLIKGLRTINTICNAIKDIIGLTETLSTSFLIPYNSIHIIGGTGRISKIQISFHAQEHTF